MAAKNKKPKKNNPQGKNSAHKKNSARTRHINSPKQAQTAENNWIYGRHAVTAVLQNPKRTVSRVLFCGDSFLESDIRCTLQAKPERVTRSDIDAIIGENAVHQNLAAQCLPLPQPHIEDLLTKLANCDTASLLFLDQVTDPQNIGAILRSAAAFDCAAVIVPDRNAPPVTASLAKTACGALETVPLVRVTNLKRAIEQTKEAGFWTMGLDGTAQTTLAKAGTKGKIALVMGSEGKGLRRLTREYCDLLVKLPMSPDMESLNVSVAAAIGLYELYKTRE